MRLLVVRLSALGDVAILEPVLRQRASSNLDVLFLVAAVLMFANKSIILGLSYITYIEYVYNKWVVVLLIAALLQLYSMHRIGSELEKEAKK